MNNSMELYHITSGLYRSSQHLNKVFLSRAMANKLTNHFPYQLPRYRVYGQ